MGEIAGSTELGEDGKRKRTTGDIGIQRNVSPGSGWIKNRADLQLVGSREKTVHPFTAMFRRTSV